jgi:hypothetical protein
VTRALDLLERTAWTAVQAFLAVWIVNGDNLWSVDAALVAGTAAAIAAAKCLLAFQIGSPNTAATLPAGPGSKLGGSAPDPAPSEPA